MSESNKDQPPAIESDSLLQANDEEAAIYLLLGDTSGTTKSHRKAHSEIPTGGLRRHKGRHHRHKSSLGQIFESMSSGLGTIAEGIEAEAAFVRETWKKELKDADQGMFFMDMTMTRSLSVLPESLSELVEDVMHETVGHDSYTQLTAPPSTTGKIELGPYLGLLGAVLAVSSNSTSLNLLTGVPPPMKYFWKMTVTAIVLSYFAISHMVKDGGLPKLSPGRWMTMIGAIVCFTASGITFVTALQYTSIGNVIIGANSQAMLLILGNLLVGKTVHWMEKGGVFVAFCGCVLCSCDAAKNSAEGEGTDAWTALLGDALAFSSGLFGVGYLTCAKAVRSEMPVTVFMFLVMACGSLCVVLYMALTGSPMQFNNDPYTGLFGWMNLTGNRIFIMLHIAIICNVLGTMGFVRAMQYLENVIIAVATLLEPLMATFIAFLVLGTDLPGPMGWIGNALVVMGTLGVVYPSASKSLDQ
jgi:drug/metabolite transporter (DMT)-like permease